ncbi:hypothetical protein HAX54_001814, partial [Datura stramonium]|nr:hypothetical protein [Datura stramonium]
FPRRLCQRTSPVLRHPCHHAGRRLLRACQCTERRVPRVWPSTGSAAISCMAILQDDGTSRLAVCPCC